MYFFSVVTWVHPQPAAILTSLSVSDPMDLSFTAKMVESYKSPRFTVSDSILTLASLIGFYPQLPVAISNRRIVVGVNILCLISQQFGVVKLVLITFLVISSRNLWCDSTNKRTHIFTPSVTGGFPQPSTAGLARFTTSSPAFKPSNLVRRVKHTMVCLLWVAGTPWRFISSVQITRQRVWTVEFVCFELKWLLKQQKQLF